MVALPRESVGRLLLICQLTVLAACTRLDATLGAFGYTFVGEPGSGSAAQLRNHLWFAGWAQEFEVVKDTSLLSRRNAY